MNWKKWRWSTGRRAPAAAGALFGSLPVVILYSFFADYCVSSMTGAVKE
jgi:ABC-type maltose transport system permease subunit